MKAFCLVVNMCQMFFYSIDSAGHEKESGHEKQRDKKNHREKEQRFILRDERERVSCPLQ